MRLWGKERPPTSPAEMAAAALAERFREAGQAPTVTGSSVTCGIYKLDLTAHVENEGQQQGHHLLGMGYSVTLNDRPAPALYAGTVGIGPSRQTAFQEAAADWSQLVGTALASALFGGGAAPIPTLGRYRVFSGGVALRGQADVEQLKTVVPALLTALEPWNNSLPTPKDDLDLHALSIAIVVDERGAVEGECRFDARVSPGLLQTAQQVAWPPGLPSYMLKRYYVLRPNGE